MDDYIGYWGMFAILALAISYLVMKYGKMQYDQGHARGKSEGHVVGHVRGIRAGFEFLEKLGFVDLDKLELDLQAGVYDHIGEIGQNREKVEAMISKGTKK